MEKQKLIFAMRAAGYEYDDLESRDDWVRFFGDYCTMLSFGSWGEVEEWLNGVVFDDPDISDRVERIMKGENLSEIYCTHY